jgi:hypothetical protein
MQGSSQMMDWKYASKSNFVGHFLLTKLLLGRLLKAVLSFSFCRTGFVQHAVTIIAVA